MKLLGHVHIAITAFPQFNQELLAFGALLPETVFYTQPKVLTYEQIHEGGLKLYNFCKSKYPDYSELGIGSLTHSVKYGADSFNSLECLVPLGYESADVPRIAAALGVELKIAQARAHNLYDLVLDYYINKKYPNIREITENTKMLDLHIISKILSECYEVSQNEVFLSLTNLWQKYDLSFMDSFEGLAMFWKSLASDLKEKDPVDIEKTANLLEDFHTRVSKGADEFLGEVVNKTKSNISVLLY